MPAWKGLAVLERFYRMTAGLTFEGVPMTHRAAIIFCHYNAPILQIRRLAEILLRITKKNITRQFEASIVTDPALVSLDQAERTQQLKWLSNAKYGNAAGYLVLESFDMLRGSLEKYLGRYYGIDDFSGMLLYGQDMADLRGKLKTIREAVPKGRVVSIAQAMSKRDMASAEELRSRLSGSVAPDQRDAALSAVDSITNGNEAGWYLLADLWDYAEEWKA